MAVASDRARSTVIEATEFPELSRAYQVMGVPKVVINDRVQFEGALPEHEFLGAVLQAVETIRAVSRSRRTARRPRPSSLSRTGSGRSPRRPDLLFAYGTL